MVKEKSSKIEKLLKEDKEEKAKLVARCNELVGEVCWEAAHVHEVPPEVVRKIKDDYLTSKKF